MSPEGEPDDVRRLVEEAREAARAAHAAVERMEREAPSRLERILDAVRGLLATFVELVVGRLRGEIDRARRAGEDLLDRVTRAVSDGVRHLVNAAILASVTIVLLAAAVVTLLVAVARALNEVFGDPWGILATGLLLLAAAASTWRLALGRVRAVATRASGRGRRD